ncbi:sphingolipid C9-methyltransferase [Verticillium alfalfae VaMs.102]|uniref:sphingolipid C(9)-methyltransferase n=1 Tax=Verticillium alfalfae (strain VaMs.102 / ATCC MYA-4576 / FGSC 10136) TaxID=526221 RepID=C9SPS5_VERA1|nr:sphingolipid C9-methyltransferase [Verticillium alfalfae VaMs.102]EEY20790.1 sphingolipid C9-methyltransferase [Verticillium alfalfae VaMs.102]
MAAAPDIASLTSSADVFTANHTLPQIRAIHRALHVQIDDKAARLRTQVGSSYRGLLGTADSIVQMRQDNDAVQALLARMGHRCGRAVVGRKLEGYAEFASEAEDPRMAVLARARLLDACALVVGKLLLKGRGANAAARREVLVLSRLLSKGFTREELAREPDAALVVDTARKTLEGLRRRLLRSIEKFLEKTADNQAQRQDHTLKALCAYSLATSSGARDVLKHFLTVRSKAMSAAFYADGDAETGRLQGGANVLKSQLLYVRTLLDVQALVPSKLSDALANLKKRPLLQSDVLRNVEALRLDVYERWCGDDILTFTPFIRHDDLDGPQARSMLTSWAERGGEVLVAGLRSTMERMTEFKAVIDLRTSVLRLWIRDGGKARGFDPSEMLDALREAINGHLLALIEAKVHKLHLVASEVAATLDAWKDGVTDRPTPLWAQTTLDIDPAAGVDAFLQDLVAQLHGRNDAVARAVTCFASWRRVIGEVEGVVDELKKQRWENDGDDDDDEIEDEETIDARHAQLSRDDPAALHDRLDATLARAFAALETRLADLWRARAGAVNAGPRRHVHAPCPARRARRACRGSKGPGPPAFRSFGLENGAMGEHVGVRKFPAFLKQMHDLLDDDGVCYFQLAGLRKYWQYEDLIWGLFMNKYVFPGAEASTPLGFYIDRFEGAGFEVRNIDTIGVHYSGTLFPPPKKKGSPTRTRSRPSTASGGSARVFFFSLSSSSSYAVKKDYL